MTAQLALREDYMSKSIVLAHDLRFSADVVTQTLAILARKGSGKSFTLRRRTKEDLAKFQIVRPVGDQQGLGVMRIKIPKARA